MHVRLSVDKPCVRKGEFAIEMKVILMSTAKSTTTSTLNSAKIMSKTELEQTWLEYLYCL